ncbi:membrane protein [Methylacidiphilum kamchatkense Kam1]|uniref:Membrane protein n=1 Tax=Methylacidiphilum kamchatkense Kam1 TaxID=1202785 RepID=A0ABR4ZX63_9BACT|nr:efflux RND transporter periplasmic adaptor subunit [Methylacidiphilum kamchatkense]KIE58713.1 membrane protein [Methylacidiphilum kamchatkense Kam1]
MENDTERIEFLVVNYVREIAGCDRTCLFTVPLTNKGFSFLTTQDFAKANVFELKAVSSLSKIHKQSDQALLLKEAGIALFRAANPHHFQDLPPKPKKSVFAMFFDEEQAIEDQKINTVEKKESSPLRIGFAMRESATKERPLAIMRYFQNIPMNWLAAFPLMDQQQRVYGFISWEGKEKIIPSLDLFNLLQKIAIVGGKSVARAYFNQKKFWIFSKTTRTHPLLNPLVFYSSLLVLILIVAFFPLPMKIKGNAVLIPSFEMSVPALVSAKIESIHVQIGDYVKKGTLLIQLDPTNILLKIKEVEQDYKKNMAEADLAQNLKQETAMQLSRLNALKSQAVLKSLYNDFHNSSIRAPIDGVVMGPSNLMSRRGDIPQVGEVLVQLADPRYWKVKIALREQDFIYLGRVIERQKEPLVVSFRLAADPSKSYRLLLRSLSQFISGVETEGKKYEFSLIIPWEEKNIDPLLLKKGLRGQAKVYVGLRPLAYIAFRDVIGFLRLHVFFW